MIAQRHTRGAAGLEFALVVVPLLFVLISTFEMCRAMWAYQTLAFAVKEGTRYAVVHGQNCTMAPNTCTATISQIASIIQSSGQGLATDALTLTFTPSSGSATSCVLQDCLANYATTAWPPGTANAPGEIVVISGVYRLTSALAMFWPGMRPVNGSPTSVSLTADARESMQY